MPIGNADIVVIGAGASGYFAAIHAKATNPKLRVIILEKSDKILAKVRISGGGRCNVTHHELDIPELLNSYPRGKSLLKWPMRKWSVINTIRWFERHNVPLKTEEDGRMFPVSDSSESVIEALTGTANQLGVEVFAKTGVSNIEKKEGQQFEITTDRAEVIESRSIIAACGGFPKLEQFRLFTHLGIEVVPPVPSLFTFNLPDKSLHELMGISVTNGKVKIVGMEGEIGDGWFEGPILITHWGISGPAVLKASAWLARPLHSVSYNAKVLVDWAGLGEEKGREQLGVAILMNSAKRIDNLLPFGLPRRLWEFILGRAKIPADKICRDLSKADKNRILEQCIRCAFEMNGKTTYKEEFVTAGGIAITEINKDNMECKHIPGLFFAGELIDIDGVTGGYNFQAAWATGQMAGVSAAHSLK